jgi:hypothetical protein
MEMGIRDKTPSAAMGMIEIEKILLPCLRICVIFASVPQLDRVFSIFRQYLPETYALAFPADILHLLFQQPLLKGLDLQREILRVDPHMRQPRRMVGKSRITTVSCHRTRRSVELQAVNWVAPQWQLPFSVMVVSPIEQPNPIGTTVGAWLRGIARRRT